MKRRLFSILLILALLMTLVPVGAFAEGEPAVVTEETEAQTTATPEPTAEPTQEPKQTPTSEPTALPTPEPTAEPIPEPASEPVQESVEETAPAVPAEPAEGDSNKVAAQEPEGVKVVFIFTPAEVKVELSVYTKDENGCRTEIKPEKDDSWMLVPGCYYYALKAEGYEPVEDKNFEVRASDYPLEVSIGLKQVELKPAEEETAIPLESGEEITVYASDAETDSFSNSNACNNEGSSDLETTEISAPVSEENHCIGEIPGGESFNIAALDEAASGTCGNNLTWTLDDTGSLIIHGTGVMDNYNDPASYAGAPWYRYRDSIKSVVIESGVTSIGSYAFYGCRNMTSVTIPEGVPAIGYMVFSDCTNLTSITLPLSITEIGDGAITTGPNAHIYYPGTVTQWMEIYFYYYLEGITIHCIDTDGVSPLTFKFFGSCGDELSWILNDEGELTILGSGKMDDCYQGTAPWEQHKNDRIKSVIITDQMTYVGAYAFSSCHNLTKVTIPDSVTSIGRDAFSGCEGLTSAGPIGSGCDVEFGWKTMIPAYAFKDCQNLVNASIPEGITTIGDYAFYYCGLTRIAIPKSLTSIGEGAFGWDDQLQYVYYTGTSEDRNNISIGYDNEWLEAAGWFCQGLLSGACGEKLTWTLDTNGTMTISGTGTMNDYNQWLDPVPWNDYRDIIKTVVVQIGVTSIGSYAFYECDELTSVSLPSGFRTIGNNAFSGCSALSEPIFPSGLREIKYNAFTGCTSLKSISLPDSLRSLGGSVFSDCTALKTVRLSSALQRVGDFTGCTALESIVIPEGVTDVSGFDGCTALYTVTLPGTVTSVGGFKGCTSLTSIYLPDSVHDIYYSAFEGCTSLESIHILGSIYDVGERAFYNCSALTSITLKNVQVISKEAFAGCSALAQVSIDSSTLYSIAESAFEDCVSLREITIPMLGAYSYNEIGYYVFSGCDNLETVTIIGNQVKISNYAFNPCDSLTEIHMMGDMPQISNRAFTRVTATVHYPRGNTTYTTANMGNYGGNLTWVGDETFFSDVADTSAYYFKPVYWAAANGITTGTSDTTFSPNQACTRGQIVTFLWRASGSPASAGAGNPFKDVKAGAYYYDAVLWAVEKGITTGTSATTFAPNDPCTRKQIVTFLWRAQGSPKPASSANPFKDVKATDYFYDAVLWAVERGITTGTTATTFAPNAACSRGQCVTFLMRAVGSPEP